MAQSESLGGDLQLVHLTKIFGTFTAVDDLNLVIPKGSFFALLGPSGCGKTTTLRMVAGLEEPTSGQISIGEKDISYERPYRRPVNTVFQSYALFPHLDIFENVAFGLRRRKIKDVKPAVDAILSLVELDGFARRMPAQLSGGQQQRVAVARALINKPEVLLLDEPLGALDLKLRRQMQIELKRIQVEVGITFVHVTHDQEEAMTMADTIAVMNAGRVEQMGSPTELYENPRTTFVANFLGQSNLIAGKVIDRSDDLGVDLYGNHIRVPRARTSTNSESLWVGVRPEKINITLSDKPVLGVNVIPGVVTDASYIGVSTQYLVKTAWGEELMVFEQNLLNSGARPGDHVNLSWDPAHTFALDANQDVDAGVEVLEADS